MAKIYNLVQENHSGFNIFEIGISQNNKCDNLVNFPKSGCTHKHTQWSQ